MGAGCVSGTPVSDAPARSPNILIFVTDDQRATGTLGVMPNVRRWFVREGTEYTNAFATTPLCCPSRASILTGRYAHNHGVKTNTLAHELDQSATIQSHLQRAGYRTGIAGKFLNQWGTGEPPAHFDRYAIFLEGEYYDRQWNIDGDVARLPDYTNDVVREKALEFLEGFEEGGDAEPWFLYVGTNAGHAPFTPEPRYAEAPVPPLRDDPSFHESDLSDKPVFGEIRGRTRSIRARQLRTFMSADDLIGEVMTWLEDHGELEDTAAVFMSDNGIQWGEHGFTGKRQVYTPSIHIPLFLRWEDAPSEADTRLAATVDVAPTVFEIAGVDTPPTVDGRSLLGSRRRKVLLLEHWADSETRVWDWSSLRTSGYQYVEYRPPGGPRVRNLFDLRQDPFQLIDVADRSENRRLMRAFAAKLSEARRCVSRACP